MRLGLGSYACAWSIGVPGYAAATNLHAAGLIERAGSLGLKVVQIADNIPLGAQTAGQIEGIRAAASRAGIELELGTRGIFPRHVERFIRLCGDLDARLLRVVVDTADHHPSPQEVVSMVRTCLPTLTASGVTLAIENHDRFSSRTLAAIIEQIGSSFVGVCLDTVNSFGALETPEQVVEILGPHTVNLHLKDFTISREPHAMGFRITGSPAGQGLLNIPYVLERVRSFQRDMNAILELWPAPEPSAGDTEAKEERWCAESVRYLRTLIPN